MAMHIGRLDGQSHYSSSCIPTGNDSDPCAFTDRNSLLDRVTSDWQDYNVSLLVETCAEVCVLVYGTGNPDISGIGVSRYTACATREYPMSNKIRGHDFILAPSHSHTVVWARPHDSGTAFRH